MWGIWVFAGGESAEPDLAVYVDDSLTGGQWIRAAVIFVGAIIVSIVVSRTVRSLLAGAVGTGFAAKLTARLLAYAVFIVGVLYALGTLGVQVGPLLGALGLGGLVLALALQKLVESFIGSMILQTRRPFTAGDTVRLGDQVGVVTDIDSRTVVLSGLDGTTIRVPNSAVLAGNIVNLTEAPLRRSELTVGVAYDTDLDRATDALTEAARRTGRVATSPAPLIVVRRFADSSIEFTVFYWHASDVPSELATTHDLVRAIHFELASAGISIAFPQMTVWPAPDIDDNPYQSAPRDLAVGEHSDVERSTGARRSRVWRRDR